MGSGELGGSEALVRWQHPELGLLPPGRFIGLAEDTGLILDIGEFVLREACSRTKVWQGRGFAGLRIAVNISARHFQQKNFSERLVEILGRTRVDPACLELALTETSIIEHTDAAVKVLGRSRKLGVKGAS